MLKNAPSFAIGGVDTEENEHCEVCPLSVSPDPQSMDARCAMSAEKQERRTYLGDLYTESGQTLQCSFSSVSTPPIARVGAFFSIFHDLQDIHAFAPLQTQNFTKKIANFFHNFTKKFPNSSSHVL